MNMRFGRLLRSLLNRNPMALLCLLLSANVPAADTLVETSPALVEQGRRIYQEGILGDGRPLSEIVEQAELHHDVRCVRCHRRSGLGGGEGGELVPPVTGPYLFRERLYTFVEPVPRRHRRPAYKPASLHRVLSRGIDVVGEQLSGFMPLYRFSKEDLKALSAYLAQLSLHHSPGVEEARIHFATVVDSRLPAAQQRALIDTAQRFVERENAVLRAKQKRTRFRTRQVQWNVDSFRQWQLHIWRLDGAPDSWPAQLQARLASQPVFAVLGGSVAGKWAPIHDFCEAQSLPCLFPHTDQPKTAGAGHFTFYFSRGVEGEAALLATHLSSAAEPSAPLLQVYRRGTAGERAAEVLRERLGAGRALREYLVSEGGSLTVDSLRQALADVPGGQAVLWLEAADLAVLSELAADDLPAGGLYLSGSLPGNTALSVPESWRAQVRLLHPFSLPWRARAGLTRRFVQQEKIAVPGQFRLQAETFAAFSAVSQVLHKARHNLLREYFIERVEHMSEDLRATGLYPQLSLAPGQRYASNGGYLLPLSALAGDDEMRADVRWQVP